MLIASLPFDRVYNIITVTHIISDTKHHLRSAVMSISTHYGFTTVLLGVLFNITLFSHHLTPYTLASLMVCNSSVVVFVVDCLPTQHCITQRHYVSIVG